jgi:hypothetical protein
MRQRFVQVLEREEGEHPMNSVVRRFWSREPVLANEVGGAKRVAQVVDLAGWSRARAEIDRP